jgi:4-hydroxy-tetrahydrodipicolinate synthase
MNTEQFKGLGVAMVCPFTSSSEVDYPALRKLTRHLVDGGCNYLVVHGTTGEAVTLTADEKVKVLQTILDENKGALPVVLGLGGNNTLAVLELIKAQNFEGISAILSVSPYYNKPTQEGIYQHYKLISEASPVPIILYNVPGRTASNMSPETTLRLANDFDNIIAVKEASGNLSQVMEIIADKPTDFLVISGDDELTLPMVAAGVSGAISVVGNAYPTLFSGMIKDTMASKLCSANEAHYKLLKTMRFIFEEGNPAGIKSVLKTLGICGDEVRLPLMKASSDLEAKLAAEAKLLS